MSRTKWAIDGQDGTVLEVNGRKFGATDDGAPMLASIVSFMQPDFAYLILWFSVQWFVEIWVVTFTLTTAVLRMQQRVLEQIYNISLQECFRIQNVPKISLVTLFIGDEQVGRIARLLFHN